jgi:hypothetical protein
MEQQAGCDSFHDLAVLILKRDHGAAAERLQRGAVQPNEFARFVNGHNLQVFVFFLLGGSRPALAAPAMVGRA